MKLFNCIRFYYELKEEEEKLRKLVFGWCGFSVECISCSLVCARTSFFQSSQIRSPCSAEKSADLHTILILKLSLFEEASHWNYRQAGSAVFHIKNFNLFLWGWNEDISWMGKVCGECHVRYVNYYKLFCEWRMNGAEGFPNYRQAITLTTCELKVFIQVTFVF